MVLITSLDHMVSGAWVLTLLVSFSLASSAIVKHTFNAENMLIRRLCNEQIITAVNGKFPGPTIQVREGDTLVVHVFNYSPFNITIHWHGIFQMLSAWADGPEFVTQCPIQPGNSYSYRFNITGQEGTLWWHAHSSFLRVTVHGALFIRPRNGRLYTFPTPYKEVPILLGEWWKINAAVRDPQALDPSVAFMINGLPGDLYDCSQDQMFKLNVEAGKTYLLRIINANLLSQMFFKLANHNFTVVAVDAMHTTHFVTDVVMLAPGQTTDVLLKANQPVASYYMAASIYYSTNATFDHTKTRGLVIYKGSQSTTPLMPLMPLYNDTTTANKFYTNITSLPNGPHWTPCPKKIDEHFFIVFGVNLERCPNDITPCGPVFGFRFSASMNNESFVYPSGKNMTMLEAFYNNVSGVYTKDFPNKPPYEYDYTSPNTSLDFTRIFAPKSTKATKLKFNSTVEIVLQSNSFLDVENHPMHLHGFNFYVLAQGYGNYNSTRDRKKFNLVNPQMRNTIAVPRGGWAVIRFRANNPGIWLMHCHIDTHSTWGMAMAFEIENGPTSSSTLPPPPPDLPKC